MRQLLIKLGDKMCDIWREKILANNMSQSVISTKAFLEDLDRGARGDHIINNQYPPVDGPAEDQPVLVVILRFLAVAAERIAGLIMFLQSDRERRRERNPLLGYIF